MQKITINYGMKDQDPLKLHVFYNKRDEQKDKIEVNPIKVHMNCACCIFTIIHEQTPIVLVPRKFEEVCHFWYHDTYKHEQDQNAESAKDCLDKLTEWVRAR